MTKLFKKMHNKKRGFTLIELIVVIAILGILAAILVPSMLGFINDANEGTLKANVRSAYSATQAYYVHDVSTGGTGDGIDTDPSVIETYMGPTPADATITVVQGDTAPYAIVSVAWDSAASGKRATYTVATGAIVISDTPA